MGYIPSSLCDELTPLAFDHATLVDHCIVNDVDLLNTVAVSRFTNGIWSRISNAQHRSKRFKELISRGYWKALPKRGHSSAPCVPVIGTRNRFKDMYSLTASTTTEMQLVEVFDLARIKQYVGAPGRSDNDSVLLKFFENKIAKPLGDARTRGALSKEVLVQVDEFKEHQESLRSHVAQVSRLVDLLNRTTGVSPQMAPSPPSQPLTTTLTIVYKYILDTIGRRYGQGLCCQNMSKRMRFALCNDDVMDLDIQNCMVTLLVQVVDKLQVTMPLRIKEIPALRRYAEQPRLLRQEVFQCQCITQR